MGNTPTTDRAKLRDATGELAALGYVVEPAVAAVHATARSIARHRAATESRLGRNAWAFWTQADDRIAFGAGGDLAGPLMIRLGGTGIHGPLQLALQRAGFTAGQLTLGPTWCIVWPSMDRI